MLHFIFLFVLLFNMLSGLALATPVKHSQELIIDTDLGVDDAIAILYLLNQAHIKVKAITIESTGNAHCEPAFANTQGLLQLVNQTQIPVACGRATPLQHKPRQTAKELLIETLVSAKGQIDILAIGPLTNIAEVLEEQPGLKNKIRRIYIMGGAIRVGGNIKSLVPLSRNQTAEWNIYIDPRAAQIVFHSGLSLILIPLDVTNQALIDDGFYSRLRKNHQTPTANFVYQLLRHNQQMLRDQAWYFWDPMAAAIAVDESLASIQVLPLSVRLEPESLAGTTVVDQKDGGKVGVCMGIKVEEFKEDLLRGLWVSSRFT